MVTHPFVARLLLGASLLFTAPAASAQGLPAGPLTAFNGKLAVGGDVMATAGAKDDTAFFNYTDYEHNALRRIRLGISAVWQPQAWLALLADVRSENFEQVTPYGAYVRVHPWRNRVFDIQAGRIPPVFGAFGRRVYALDNPLIGYPLAYQYLTSLRSTAVPATTDDLLRMRGRGWRSSFPVGEPTPGPGLPVVNGFRFDTGVQARWRTGPVELAGSVTNGTLSNPRVSDDNGGRQISGRVAFVPVVGLVIGVSGARGAWISDAVPRSTPDRPQQSAWGSDVEYSRAHWLVRAEMVRSGWDVPFTGSSEASGDTVTATAAWLEGRYRFTPRIFAAARADRLTFSKITGTLFGGAPTPWDAPVSRLEATGGYYLKRNLVARITAQANWRDGGRERQRMYIAAQLTSWF